MRNKLLFLMLGTLLSLLIVFTSCTPEATPTPTTSEPTATPTPTATPEANWWDEFGEPQYGGELVIRTSFISGGSFDTLAGRGMSAGGYATNSWQENWVAYDWALDRDIWAFPSPFGDLEYYQGMLAESWEWKDPTTFTIHLREGVYWEDKPPVNGREFTSDDVVYSYDRVLGTGNGYTEPHPLSGMLAAGIEKAVAVDKYTVDVKLSRSGYMMAYNVLGIPQGVLPVAREWIEQSDLTDFQNVNSLGAFILTDFVENVSMTMSPNPNYWGYDERWPENKLPYVDNLKILSIADLSTAMGALRTGKIDMMTDDMGCLNWQQGQTLAESNPDIQQSMTEKGAASIYPRIDTEPFDDIKVRQALQMAVNIPEIAEGYYGGTATGKPVTLLSQTLTGWVTPFDEWPEDLQAEYTYNPTRARELLAEAGYPNGFETSCLIQTNQDGALLQVVKSYFNDIGVDLEIQSEEPSVAMSIVSSGSYEAMSWNDAGMGVDRPSLAYGFFLSSSSRGDNRPFVNDPDYEAMVSSVLSAPTLETAQQASIEANEYVARQHWATTVCTQYWPQVWQPYVKGFSGERVNYHWFAGPVRARLWIDQDMKETMGY